MKWFPSRVIAPPATEPVTIARARRQCGLADDDTSRDDDLTDFIASARVEIENMCAVRLIRQTVAMYCDDWRMLDYLWEAPIIDPDAAVIEFVSPGGIVRTLDADAYVVRADNLSPQIVPAYGRCWPTIQCGSRITVTADVGYGDTGAAVPPPLISAMLLRIGLMASTSGRDVLVRTDDVDGVGSTTYGGIIEISSATERAIGNLLADYRRKRVI